MGMDLYGISDLHLGPGSDKGHYSSKWKEHQPAIRQAWDERIPPDALVLMPGDFSWHQDPEDLTYDYYWIHDRPGQLKVLSPGNHDYGVWTDPKKVIEFCAPYDSLQPLMGDALRIANPASKEAPGMVIVAVRGTQSPGDRYFDSNSGSSAKNQDPEAVLFIRELARLRAALRAGAEIMLEGDELVVMIHYPPFVDGVKDGPFNTLIEQAGAKLCVYGHLHQETQWTNTFQGERAGVDYRFVGTDFLGFSPTRLGEWNAEGLLLNPIERRANTVWTTKENYSSYTQNKTNNTSAPPSQASPAGSPSTSAPAPSAGPNVRVATDGFGRQKICEECVQSIFEGQSHHYTTAGPVHGVGEWDSRGTCSAIRKVSWNNALRPIVCSKCELYILNHEPMYHVSGNPDRWSHGNQQLGCLYKNNPQAQAKRQVHVKQNPAAPSEPKSPNQVEETDYLPVMEELQTHAHCFANGQMSEEDLEREVDKILENHPKLPLL